MPHGARPCGLPASQSASQRFKPWSIVMYSSHPRSPTYEIRDASTRSVPTSIVLQVPNLNPSLETSSEVTLDRMSRARGPHSPIVVIDEVRSETCADPSAARWSLNHFLSPMPEAPPVTTRNRSSPNRMIVRSDLKPPFGLRTGV